jgi:hypothetical protein
VDLTLSPDRRIVEFGVPSEAVSWSDVQTVGTALIKWSGMVGDDVDKLEAILEKDVQLNGDVVKGVVAVLKARRHELMNHAVRVGCNSNLNNFDWQIRVTFSFEMVWLSHTIRSDRSRK